MKPTDPVIWLGAEPTFTLRESQDPCWLWEAEGGGKQAMARRLCLALAARFPGALMFESLGRQYPGEALPRFSFGLYFRRDGAPLWDAPPPGRGDPVRMRDACVRALPSAVAFAAGSEVRLAYPAKPGGRVDLGDPALLRSSIHGAAIPEGGLQDLAARSGIYVLAFGAHDGRLAVELPALASCADACALLAALARAARDEGLPGPVLRGFAPPINDPELAWLTVTPDPAVIEVNLAPAPDLAVFEDFCTRVYAAATEVGLSAVRYRYNGAATDSGGGGQLTFGGPSPADSPFFRVPHLLPSLLRYLNRHPALSYSFAMDALGSAGQGPRSDEGVRERFEELPLALEVLEGVAGAPAPPEALWRTLAPLLVDCSGNAHRAEVNIEKLCNPHLPGRGCLGLVELRALRMPPSATALTAVARLFHAILVRLAREPYREPLRDWGAELHDRFALPHFLAADLEQVLADLAGHDLRPSDADLAAALPPREPVCTLELDGVTLCLTPALEFWPLLGDVASQEQRAARLVDASSARLELLAEGPRAAELAVGVVLASGVHQVVLERDDSRGRPLHLTGLRYRVYRPAPGLHPTLGAHDPLTLTASVGPHSREIALYGWIPGGGVYDGVPKDADEARRRRNQRCVVRPRDQRPTLQPIPSHLRSRFTVDVRRLAPLP